MRFNLLRFSGVPHTMSIPNGGGNGNGRDWMSLRAWSQAIGIIGIPGAIAIYLVYIGATQVPKLVVGQEASMARDAATQEKIKELIEVQNATLRTLQKICVSLAKDDDGRQRCFDR